MLKQRIITAIILLAVLLPALAYPSPKPFALVTLVMIGAGAWEWGRLNKLGSGASWTLGLVAVLICAGLWQGGWLEKPSVSLWLPIGALWVLVGASLIKRGVEGWSKIAGPLRVAGGLLALCLTWLAIGQARVIGINFLLSVLVLVWVADIAAYFAGRAFGLRFTKVKLAPAISPGKSWEGVWGGMVGVMVLALGWIWADHSLWPNASPSLYSRLASANVILLIAAVVFLAAMSVVGDLVESLIKRSAGVKDSSNLLPGHGGVLDRVDALLPAVPLAMMLYAFVA